MRIQVRVATGQAIAGLKAVEGAMGGLNRSFARGAQSHNQFRRIFQAGYLEKYGKNLQWTGRQIEYNFTLPILAAGIAAGKFAVDNERAFIRLVKVYGDFSMSAQQVKSETDALRKAFRALSDEFGVAQDEVIGIGAAFAQAGSSGIALARQTRLAMELMILGEMEAEEATRALIAIQAQYGLSTTQMTKAVAQLNMIENQTSVSLQDLVNALSRAGGAARSAGVPIRQLAALTAALVPATGTAANAGNALRTMISRIMSPTGQAVDLFRELGIEVNSASWNSKNFIGRLKLLERQTDNLTNSQKANLATVIASRWQVNRFDVLLRDLVNTNGSYQRALEATRTEQGKSLEQQQYMIQYTRELGIVLSSTPQAFSILWTRVKNLMAEAIVPLLPVILALISRVVNLVRKFTELSPRIQQNVFLILAAIAAVGTFTRILGALILLAAKLGGALRFVFHIFTFFGGAIFKVVAIAAKLIALPFLGFFKLLGAGFAGIGLIVGRFGKTLGLIGKIAWGSFVLLVKASIYAVLAVIGNFGMLVRGIGTVFGGVYRVASAAMLGIWGMARTVVTLAVSAVGPMLTAVGSIVTTTVAAAGTALTTGLAVVGTIFGAFMARMITFGQMMGTFVGLLARPFIILGAQLPVIWAATMRTMATLTMGLGAFFSRIGPVLVGIWAAISRGIAVVFTVIGPAIAAVTHYVMTAIYVMVGAIATALAALPGLIATVWGAIPKILFGGLKIMVGMAAAGGKAIALAFSGPWGWIAVAIGVVLLAFRNQIADAVRWVAENFRQLPRIFQQVLQNLVTVISSAVKAAYEWLSYLNPFARHSPSLVEQVIKGVNLIARQYRRLSGIGNVFRGAIEAMRDFGAATAAASNRWDRATQRKQRADVVWASGPAAGSAYDGMLASINRLEGALADVARQYGIQQQKTNAAESALTAAATAADNASNKLERMQEKLADLQKVADSASEALSGAQAELDRLANMPIKGMGEMSDAIFANEMAQKALRLEMMKLEDAHGPIEDTRSALAQLAGELEGLRTNREDLRLAGAGSDVLAAIDTQINQMENARSALESGGGTGPAAEMERMRQEMERLQREGERLDLENSLTFDPLTRQIDQLVNGTKEMSFDKIINGIKTQQAEVAKLTTEYEKAQAAVDKQQARVDNQQQIVDGLNREREAAQALYDLESQRLADLGAAYNSIEQQIRDMTAALDDFAGRSGQAREAARQARDAAKQKAKDKAEGRGSGDGPAVPSHLETFRGAASGDYELPGGKAGLGREGGMGDQTAEIEALADQWAKDAQKEFGSFDLFKPMKKKLKEFWERVKVRWNEGVAWLRGKWDEVKGHFTWEGVKAGAGDLIDKLGLRGIADWFSRTWTTIQEKATAAWELIGDPIMRFGRLVWEFIKDLTTTVVAEFKNWGPTIEAVIGGVSAVVSNILVGIMFIIKTWGPVVINVLKPIFDTVVAVVRAALQIIRGILEFFGNLLQGDIGGAFRGLLTVIDGIWDAIFAVFKGAIGVVIGIFRGIIDSIIGWAQYLWKKLVGNSIIPDIVDGIVEWFEKLFKWIGRIWDNIKSAAVKAWQSIYKKITGFVEDTREEIKDIWTKAVDWIEKKFKLIKAITKLVWGAIFDKIREKLSDIKDKIHTIVTALKTWWTQKWNAIKQKFVENFAEAYVKLKEKLEDIKTKIHNVVIALKSWWAGKWSEIKQKFVENFAEAYVKLKEKLDLIKNKIHDVVIALKGWWKTKWEGIRDDFRDALNSMRDKAIAIKERMINVFDNLRTAVGRVMDKLPREVKVPINWVINQAYNNGVRKFWNAIANKIDMNELPEIAPLALNKGGRVPGVGNKDTVPAMLTPGEYVIPKQAAAQLGKGTLELLRRGQKSFYAEGGWVTGDTQGLHPEFSQRLGMWAQGELRQPYYVGSGYRSFAEQAVLYARRLAFLAGLGPYQAPTAPPGQSNHNYGLASDGPEYGGRNPGDYGLVYPMSYEPWHVEPIGARAMRGGGGGGWDLPNLQDFKDIVKAMKNWDGAGTGPFKTMGLKVAKEAGSEALEWVLKKLPLGDVISKMIGLANGGIVTGPTHALVGEAGPEAVIPLRVLTSTLGAMTASVKTLDANQNTRHLRLVETVRTEQRETRTIVSTERTETREIHFHGDLVLPNIRSGDDAEAFVRNLEAMVS